MAVSDRGKRRVLLVLLITVVLTIAIGGPLWTNYNDAQAAPVAVQGTIRSQDGVILKGINVQVYRWQRHQWDAVNAMDTDAHGRYRFEGLESGRYTVAFEDDSGVGYLESWWGGGLTASSARYREVAPGTTATMNDRVVLGAAITGHATLTDPDLGGLDATQFSIVACPLIPAKDGSGFSGVRWTRSISSLDPVSAGNWRIQNLRTGSYVLQAVDNDEYPALRGELGSRWVGVPATTPYSLGQWRQAEVFTVVNGHVYSAPSVNLTYASSNPTPALVLTIADPSGSPIAGAAVHLELTGPTQFNFQSGMHGAPFSGPHGTIPVYRPTPGTYTLTVSAPGFVTRRITFKFTPDERGESSSTVTLQPES
jgi:hypothetical protein